MQCSIYRHHQEGWSCPALCPSSTFSKTTPSDPWLSSLRSGLHGFPLCSHRDAQQCECSRSCRESLSIPPRDTALTVPDTWLPSLLMISGFDDEDSRTSEMLSVRELELPTPRITCSCQFVAVVNRRVETLDCGRGFSTALVKSVCLQFRKKYLLLLMAKGINMLQQIVEQHLKVLAQHLSKIRIGGRISVTFWSQQSGPLHTVIGQVCRGGKESRVWISLSNSLLSFFTKWSQCRPADQQGETPLEE